MVSAVHANCPDPVGRRLLAENLAEYRITLPLKGDYGQIRGFIAKTLNELPYVALESVRFERQKVNDPAIDAQLKLVLYLRRTA